MKKSIVLVFCLLFGYNLTAQSLLDRYKKGVVKLVADAGYARENAWENVFKSYYDTLYNKPMGNRKSIILMPDGSVVVNHAYRNYYSLFDANGTFVKEFGIKNSSGKQFSKTGAISGVINNQFFTGLDNAGNMVFFDFNGDYVKSLTLNYMSQQIIPLGNNKLAVTGWVIWSDRFRDFVAIVDYQTNTEKIIWDQFTQRQKNSSEIGNRQLFYYTYRFEKRGILALSTMPYLQITGVSSPPQIAFVNDNLIVGLPHTGEILTYDINGQLKSKNRMEGAKKSISVEEQKEIQKKAIERYSAKKDGIAVAETPSGEYLKAMETIIKQMEEDLDRITTPLPIPVFSNMIKDSDGNILFFEIPETEGGNKFNVWVYREGGNFVCQSRFECDDYELSISPSKMVFHKGYIYALQTLKNASGNPLRLVRYKLAD